MKAVFNGMYRKKGSGQLMFTYLVNGTAAELEQYKVIQETRSNRAAGTWPEADGKPLYFVNPDIILQNGGQPEPSYTLLFNQDKTNVIRDESAQLLNHFNEVRTESVKAEAQIAAEIRLGLRKVTRGVATFATPTVAAAIDNTVKPDTLLDKIATGVEEQVGEELHD